MAFKDKCRCHGWWLAGLLGLMSLSGTAGSAGAADPVSVTGQKSLLVLVVNFPDVEPWIPLPRIRNKVDRVKDYIHTVSYGKVELRTRVHGPFELPAPLADYKVSPFNFDVDRDRVRRLLVDALHAGRGSADAEDYDYIWIVVGALTRPGRGYGMIAYAANPGMLSGVRQGRARLIPLELPDGRTLTKPIIVSAENAHVGHAAHDLLHAMGGASDGRRVVPDLYDFELQSNPPIGQRMHPRVFAIHMGPWDLQSQHFVDYERPAPRLSSYTRLQLGWIDPAQITTVKPGQTRELTLAPLDGGKGMLVVRIPLDEQRQMLLENRQPYGCDTVQSASGLLVLKVDNTREEGAGIVTAVNANPAIRHLRAAPFLPDSGEQRYYSDPENNLAVAPLAVDQQGNLRLVVTTPEALPKYLEQRGKHE